MSWGTSEASKIDPEYQLDLVPGYFNDFTSINLCSFKIPKASDMIIVICHYIIYNWPEIIGVS